MNKEEARSRLLDIFYDLSHASHCSDPEPKWEDKDVGERRPDMDGCLIVKCWGCYTAQDHFLYSEDG